MTTIVKAPRTEDFLALVPRLVGFRPEQSLVLVGFRGNRTCGAMRFALPEGSGASQRGRLATTALGMLCRIPGIDGLAAIVYTRERIASADALPHDRLIDAVLDRAEDGGFCVREALCVAADGWTSYLDADRRVHDLAGLGDPRVETADRQARLPSCDLATTERFARRYRRCCAPAPTALLVLVERALHRPPGASCPKRAAEIVAGLQDPHSRDRVILHIAFGAETGSLTPTALAQLMLGRHEGRPDVTRVRDGIRLLKELTALAPASARPAPLCMLAWLSWSLGMSSVAGDYLDRALAIDPAYRLAGLLHAVLGTGHLPDWAFAA